MEPYQPIEVFEALRWDTRKTPGYMNARLPVIAPVFGGFPEIVESTGCGVSVDTSSEDTLTEALNVVLDDPERAREFGKNGRDALEPRYNWENERRKALDVVDRAMGETSGDATRYMAGRNSA